MKLKNFTCLILLVTFSWISLLFLTYLILILIVPFPPLSNDSLGRVMTSVLKVILSFGFFAGWLGSLIVFRNYIAKKNVLK